ncbi:MAG: ABC transporter substrate-binding protein [Candidatus Tectomicrobia bacterium]|nr:ABC transporter substrate-binding protein [Candidatus Tectomicrobia bacterium]
MREARRFVFRWAFVLAFAGVAGSGAGAWAQTPVLFCASWVINAERTHVIVALDKGYFKAEGLDVDFVRGSGSGDTFRRVGIGSCRFGETAAGAAILGRAQGVRGKLVAIHGSRMEETVYFFTGSGIQSPKDLEGKRLAGGPKQSSNVLMFSVLARVNGIDLSKVQMVHGSPGAVIPSLGAGQADAALSYYRSRTAFEKVAQQAGKELRWMRFVDHGLDLYQDGITASDETIAKQGDLIIKFLRGLYRGIANALNDPEGAVDIYMKHYPGQSREFSLRTLRLTQEGLFDKHYAKEGFGRINREKMASTLRTTLEAYGAQHTLTPEDVMTNRFIDQLPRDLRFPKKG